MKRFTSTPVKSSGGAEGNGSYPAVGVRSGTISYLLTLNCPVNYFGLCLSAEHPQNHLQTVFDRIVLANHGTTTGFESDNLAAAIFTKLPEPPTRFPSLILGLFLICTSRLKRRKWLKPI